MNIVQITPGTGGMYCGNCLRDNALVLGLRELGHLVLMLPLYLPLTLDEENQSAGTPIFFGGINVYLEQKSSFFRKSPRWLHQWLSSPSLLSWAAGKAAATRPEDAGELVISMLKGEEGNQLRELEELTGWLRGQGKPDVICLSNALLVGMARRLKSELGVPVACTMQGEDTFLDALPENIRSAAWNTLAERAAEVDLFLPSSYYYAERMQARLGLPNDRIRVVYNGINLQGFSPPPAPPDPPTLGYLARMNREKGLETLVEAYRLLRQRERLKNLKLRIAGACMPADEPFVREMRRRLSTNGLLGEAEFFPNVDRATKQDLLRSFSVFSVPATYGEAFGLYLLEAWATGVPVVQPRHGAFPELIEATLGGVLCTPDDPKSLAEAAEPLLLDQIQGRRMGEAGRKAVSQNFTHQRMAEQMQQALETLLGKGSSK